MERLYRIRDEIERAVTPVEAEDVPLGEAAARWLAGTALAARAAPPETCSAMDGFAVRASDVTGPAELPVRGAVYAGDAPPPALGAGEAMRIFTGATLPPGADAVVREEAVRLEGDRARFHAPARPGENVRPAGEDVAEGDVALEPGERLGPRQLALLEAVGVARVSVRRRLRVAVIATGDEVASGRTPDSNGVAVAGLLRAIGADVRVERVGDRLEAIVALLAARLDDCDAVVTIGGVSVGERDLVPEALRRAGAELRVHGVPMKPGKPFLFATRGPKLAFGLPGSPSACLVALEVFARPALLALAGATRRHRTAVRLPLAKASGGKPGRARLVWARIEDDGRVRPIGHDAAQIRGPALADALVLFPSDAGDSPEDAPVLTWLLAD